MYRIVILPEAAAFLKGLKGEPLKRIADKIDWLAEKADNIIHHPLTSMPPDLRGLCRLRVGDYRIIYWVYPESLTIKIYLLEHRSRIYISLRKLFR